MIWGTGPGCFITNNCTQPTSSVQPSSTSCSAADSDDEEKSSRAVLIALSVVAGFVAGGLLVCWYFIVQRKAKARQTQALDSVANLDGPLLN